MNDRSEDITVKHWFGINNIITAEEKFVVETHSLNSFVNIIK
jgi:hypothetical protein